MRVATVLSLLLLASAAFSVAGCSASTPAPKPASTGGGSSGKAMQAGASASAETSPQVCAECAKKKMPMGTQGSATVENGAQVIRVGVEGGFYKPNNITAVSSAPITVVFSGKAKGCLAKPTFKSLGKKADFTGGTATIDLGNLKPGTYTFTCGMGMNKATITVQ